MLQKDFFVPAPFLTRYKPYCIQIVAPIIETYLTTAISLSSIVDKKYPDLPIDYRSVRLCINNFITKMDDIFSLVMTELASSDLSWNLSEDLQFLVVPDHLKKKSRKSGFIGLYRFFLVMEHYISAIRTRKLGLPSLRSPWLLMANSILFMSKYTTVFWNPIIRFNRK